MWLVPFSFSFSFFFSLVGVYEIDGYLNREHARGLDDVFRTLTLGADGK